MEVSITQTISTTSKTETLSNISRTQTLSRTQTILKTVTHTISVSKTIYLPDDLVWEILAQMPTKALMRFKSVSKVWNSIIRNQDFAKQHSLLDGCFRGLIITDFVYTFRDFYFRGGLNTVFYANLNGDNSNACTRLRIYEHFTWNLNNIIGVTQIVKGLIGLYNDDCFTLCNISTKEMVTLPKNFHAEDYNYHLGFDPIEDVYKVLKVFPCDESYSSFRTQIFTVGRRSDLTWRNIDPSPVYCDFQSLNIDGTLYWVPSDDKGDGEIGNRLIAFHLSSESFETVPVPHNFVSCLHVVQIGGSLGILECCSGDRYRYLSLRRMKKDARGEFEGWTTEERFRLPLDDLIYAGTLPTGEMLVAESEIKDYQRMRIIKIDHQNVMKLIMLYGPFEPQKPGVNDYDSIQMCYHEENIIPLAPLLSIQQQPAVIAQGYH